MKNKIAIIGSGAMGTALAKVVFDSGNKNIIVYGIDKGELSDLENGRNDKYFDVDLPKFKTTTDLQEAVSGADAIFMVVPSVVIDKVATQINALVDTEFILISGSKGFYGEESTVSIHDGLENSFKENKFCRGVVSVVGPAHAEEIVLQAPTLVSAVSRKTELSKEAQKILGVEYFRVYIQNDVIGANVGSAYKNALAIASGMVYGAGYGVNTNAALLTRGLSEMHTLNDALGGKHSTIDGLTGLGDLIVTATSDLSRNFSFGKDFAKRGKAALETNKTVEGLHSLRILVKLAKEKGVTLPIIEELYKTVYGNQSILETKEALISRPANKE